MLVHLLGGEASGENENPDCYPLYEDEHYIGRLPQSQICLQDDSISRLHARIYKKEGDWWIEDLRSRNGVFVNARSITDSKLLEGDIITVGDLYFVLNFRRPDQLDHIRTWIEERVEDATRYHRDVVRFKDCGSSAQQDSSVITLPEGFEQSESPEPQTYSHPQTPVPKPIQINPVHSPSPTNQPPVARRRPPAQNVMGSDPTVLIICILVACLGIFALIWRFTDWFR